MKAFVLITWVRITVDFVATIATIESTVTTASDVDAGAIALASPLIIVVACCHTIRKEIKPCNKKAPTTSVSPLVFFH